MQAIICVGCSASGKTNFAKTLVEQGWVDVNRDWLRFNVISPGGDWSTYKFNNKKEKEITEIQKDMVSQAYYDEQNVIISDTNLNPATLKFWIEYLESYEYQIEVKEFEASLETLYKRDSLRANGVGQNVIYSQYQNWLEYKGRKTYAPDATKPKAVIFDIDGTLASMDGKRGPFAWDKVGGDSVKELIKGMAVGYDAQGYVILCVSGRDGVCYDLTKEWLEENDIPHWYLFMRGEGDMRKDTIIKEEIFWDKIADNYNVVGVVDDRPSVVRMWHEIKIPNVICVGNPYVEF
jgi:predicted kinase